MEGPFGKLLRERLAKLHSDRMEVLVSPGAQSFDEYRFRLGYLQALRDIEDIMDDVAKELN